MCRMYEDQLNESKTKVEELQRQLMDVTSQKARAQTESGQCPALWIQIRAVNKEVSNRNSDLHLETSSTTELE